MQEEALLIDHHLPPLIGIGSERMENLVQPLLIDHRRLLKGWLQGRRRTGQGKWFPFFFLGLGAMASAKSMDVAERLETRKQGPSMVIYEERVVQATGDCWACQISRGCGEV